MGEISIQDAIQQFLNKSRLKSGIQALRIEDIWEELMGKTIAKYTDKIQVINHTLYVTTTVAPLKNELLYQKAKKIPECINAYENALMLNPQDEDALEPALLVARQPMSRAVAILSSPPSDLLPGLLDHFPIGVDDNGYIDRIQKL